ncbi:MAG: Diguanylate cyclase, partial [Bacteroidetes bacterium]|nr:Diguanylate cyclase [Bacteroidota bacterium]
MNQQAQTQGLETTTLEKELEQSRAQLQKITAEHNALIDSLDEMLWSIDVSSSTMQVSGACEKLFGYTQEELSQIHDFWKRFIHPADQKMLEADTEHLATGITVKRQYR